MKQPFLEPNLLLLQSVMSELSSTLQLFHVLLIGNSDARITRSLHHIFKESISIIFEETLEGFYN